MTAKLEVAFTREVASPCCLRCQLLPPLSAGLPYGVGHMVPYSRKHFRELAGPVVQV